MGSGRTHSPSAKNRRAARSPSPQLWVCWEQGCWCCASRLHCRLVAARRRHRVKKVAAPWRHFRFPARSQSQYAKNFWIPPHCQLFYGPFLGGDLRFVAEIPGIQPFLMLLRPTFRLGTKSHSHRGTVRPIQRPWLLTGVGVMRGTRFSRPLLAALLDMSRRLPGRRRVQLLHQPVDAGIAALHDADL